MRTSRGSQGQKPDFKSLRQLQEEMARKVILEDCFSKPIRRIGGADLAYHGENAVASCVVFDHEMIRMLETSTAIVDIDFPYVPGLLAFREAEPIRAAYVGLNSRPDILLLNAHGIAHPRRCGAASHVGVVLACATIGVASNRLCGCWEREPEKAGDAVPLIHSGETVGFVLRSRADCRPIFVSPGHRVSLDSALSIVRSCLGAYRMPDPIQTAHRIASAALGELRVRRS